MIVVPQGDFLFLRYIQFQKEEQDRDLAHVLGFGHDYALN